MFNIYSSHYIRFLSFVCRLEIFFSGSLNFHPIKSFRIFIIISYFFLCNPIRIYSPRLYLFNIQKIRKTKKKGYSIFNKKPRNSIDSSLFTLSQLFSTGDVTRFSKRLRFTSESHFRRFRKSGCQPKGDSGDCN